MEKRRSGVVAAAMLVMTQGCSVSGQPPDRQSGIVSGSIPPQQPAAFRALDADSDGVISSAEIDGAAELLTSLDEDGDGQLSSDELNPRRRVFLGGPGDIPEGTNIVTLDMRRGDGSVEISELPPQFQELLGDADADGDGTATAADLLAAVMAAQQGGGTPPSGGRGSPLAAALDGDGDDTISAPEIAAAPQSLRTLDRDGDGALSAGELLPRPE